MKNENFKIPTIEETEAAKEAILGYRVSKYVEGEGINKGRIHQEELAQEVAKTEDFWRNQFKGCNKSDADFNENITNKTIAEQIVLREMTGYIQPLTMALITNNEKESIEYFQKVREHMKKIFEEINNRDKKDE